MCGICGIVIPSRLNRHVDGAALTRMRDILAHRGPDDEGMYLKGAAGLGHRRLSIVDVAGGRQPMSNSVCGGGENGMVWVAFNGEIYNHPQ
ncbi:MAG: asparagine synthase (glutamine-hydrolyzing), partial [Blastocatellia bacterium]